MIKDDRRQYPPLCTMAGFASLHRVFAGGGFFMGLVSWNGPYAYSPLHKQKETGYAKDRSCVDDD